MQEWATQNHDAQMEMCEELERELNVPDYVMVLVHARHNRYLLPDNSHASLEAYIDVTRAALAADVHAYQAEVTAAELADAMMD
jgi:hypothetical protein